MKRLLIVEDKESLASMLKETVEAEGLEGEVAANGAEAINRIAAGRRYFAVLTDLRMPGADGIAVLRQVNETDPDCPVIVMTAFGTIENAVEAMRLGAFDFVQKPVDVDHLLILLRRCREQRELRYENLLLKEEFQQRYGLPAIVGDSPRIVEVSNAIQRVAPTDSTVLLQGESGTGKELFARHPSALAAARATVRRHQLRRHSRYAHRERAVRARARRLHRRDGAAARQVRAGRHRHHLPRRDRRPRPGRAVEDPPRAAGAAVRARGGRAADRRRRARDLRHQPQPRRRREGAPLPRRPLLPHHCLSGDHSAAARAEGGPRRADRLLPAEVRARAEQAVAADH